MVPSDRQFVHDTLIAWGGIVALFPLVAYASLARRRRLVTPLAQLLDGQVGEQTGIFAWTLRGRFKRRPVTIKVGDAGSSGTRFCQFGLVCPAGMKFKLFRESRLDGLRRSIGLLRDLKQGFELLDGEYVFRATDSERFRALLRDSSVRQHVQVLFYDRYMPRVWLDEGVLWCQYGTRRYDVPEVGEVREILNALAALAEALEQQEQGSWTAEEPNRPRRPEGSRS
jgi:hypothetical protein